MRILIPVLIVIALSQFLLHMGGKNKQINSSGVMAATVDATLPSVQVKSDDREPKARKKPSGNALMLTFRGTLSRKRGDYRAAIGHLNKAIEVDPYFADAYCQRGFAWWQSDFDGRLEHTLSDTSRAIEIDPATSALVYIIRGQAYVENKQLGAAMDDFDRAIALNPDSHSAFGARAWAYAKAGNLTLARQDILRALALDPPTDEQASLQSFLDEVNAQMK